MNRINSESFYTAYSSGLSSSGASSPSISSLGLASAFSNAALMLFKELPADCLTAHASRTASQGASRASSGDGLRDTKKPMHYDFLQQTEHQSTNQNLVQAVKAFQETDIDAIDQSTLDHLLNQLNQAAIQANLNDKDSIGLMVHGLGPVKFTVRKSSRLGLHFSKLNANQYK